MKLSKELKVGLLAIVSLVILYLGFNFLKGTDFLSPNTGYYTVYDNVDGLTIGNQVMVNGLSVGRVRDIRIMQNQGNKLLVNLDVNSDIVLGDSTVAILAEDGLLGGKYVNLRIGSVTRQLEKNDTIASSVEQGLTDAIATRAAPIAANLDSTIISINLLAKKFASLSGSLDSTLQNLQRTSATLNGTVTENRVAIREMLTNLNNTLSDTQGGLKPLMIKANQFADTLNQMQLAQTVSGVNQSVANLNRTLDNINKGEGTLGKLAKNDSLYRNTNSALANLDSLFIDLKAHPKRYVHFSLFGKKDKSGKNKKENDKDLSVSQE